MPFDFNSIVCPPDLDEASDLYEAHVDPRFVKALK